MSTMTLTGSPVSSETYWIWRLAIDFFNVPPNAAPRCLN